MPERDADAGTDTTAVSTIAAAPVDGRDDDAAVDKETERTLKRNIVSAYNALVQVRVSTVIADIDLEVTDQDNKMTITLEGVDKERSIITQHDLVEGDIITVISTDLETNAAIRQYHAEQVESAMKVLPENLRMLVDLFQDVVDALR